MWFVILILVSSSPWVIGAYHYHQPPLNHHHHHHSNMAHQHDRHDDLEEVIAWKQIRYEIDGNKYDNDSDFEMANSNQNYGLPDVDKFFIQYNNVPIGMEVFRDKIFVTVPRRRYGIPSTLNYVLVDRHNKAPRLMPYPNAAASRNLVSVYRPRVDRCDRLWVVDTGVLEIPGNRQQIQPPSIVVYDLHTNEEILKYQLKHSDLVDELTSAGLTSITVDVDPSNCGDAYAYITDLATSGIVVFSWTARDSWRVSHPTFVHDTQARNFTVAGNVINWKDGIFSLALSDPWEDGYRRAYYHPLVSRQEFSVSTKLLRNKDSLDGTTDVDYIQSFQITGNRGLDSQSGSHDYHSYTKTLLLANVANDAITCWNVNTPMQPENVVTLVQDHAKLVYISDLKVVGDYVWVLVNQIPNFIYSRLNTSVSNFYIHRARIQNLIQGTMCDCNNGEY